MNTLSKFIPLKRRQELSIAIPASFVSDIPHLREKTFRIGLVGRAAAIFCLEEIVIFPDFPGPHQRQNMDLIATILSYMETPQYLRKQLFRIQPELNYAGTLPPLRTLHHPLANATVDLKIGEYREGIILSNSKEGALVDIGVEQPALVTSKQLKANTRVTVKIIKVGKQPKVVLVKRKEIKTYWGYNVTISSRPFGQFVKARPFDLVIATSKKGKPINSVIHELTKRWMDSKKILIAFGAPTQGLYEIATRERLNLEELADFVMNTIPNQGTETVRTEEALYASLTLLNTIGE
jgi:hypothetical protein